MNPQNDRSPCGTLLYLMNSPALCMAESIRPFQDMANATSPRPPHCECPLDKGPNPHLANQLPHPLTTAVGSKTPRIHATAAKLDSTSIPSIPSQSNNISIFLFAHHHRQLLTSVAATAKVSWAGVAFCMASGSASTAVVSPSCSSKLKKNRYIY